jgi:hypothetical protein
MTDAELARSWAFGSVIFVASAESLLRSKARGSIRSADTRFETHFFAVCHRTMPDVARFWQPTFGVGMTRATIEVS